MNLNRKFVSFAAAGALVLGLLSGCDSLPGKGAETTPAPTATPAPLPEGVPQDIILQCAGIPRDTVLMKVNGAEVDAESLLYWVTDGADGMASYGLSDWSANMGKGTMGDMIVESARQTAQLYSLVESEAKAQGLELTDENRAALAEQLEQMKAQMVQSGGGSGDGEAAYQQYIAYLGQSDGGFHRIMETSYYYDNLKQSLFGENGSQAPTDADVAAWVDEAGVLRCKHILVQAQASEDGSDDGMAAALEAANAIRADLRDHGDDAAYFDTVMAEKSEDPGSKSQPDGYLFYTDGRLLDGGGQMVQEFADGTAALAVGEIGEPVQSSFGYHIILRLAPETAELRDTYVNQKMNQVVDRWMEEAEVETTEAYDSLDFEAFYKELNAMRQAMSAALTPAPTETPQG